MITKISIKNYKKIKDESINCNKINIFVGTNNSGKSSILSAIHFALTTWNPNVIEQKISPKSSKHIYKTPFSNEELLFLPTGEFGDIAYSSLPFDANVNSTSPKVNKVPMKFEFCFNEKNDEPKTMSITFSTQVRSYIMVSNTETLWDEQKNKNELHSAYAPGVSGISYNEEFLGIKKTQRDSFHFGTAGQVFKNILYLLYQDKNKQEAFEKDLETIFDTKYKINVLKESYQFFIDITVDTLYEDSKDQKEKTKSIPINQMGVGFLQIVQILAYKHLYNPKVLIIDEPESHLHGTLIKKILAIFEQWISNEKSPIQIFFSTHSSQLLQFIADSRVADQYQAFIMNEGKATPMPITKDLSLIINMLGDIPIVKDKILLLSEDKKTELLEKILVAIDPHYSAYITIYSSNGAGNLKQYSEVLNKNHPNLKIIYHLDLDLAEMYKSRLKGNVWITDELCIEGYWIQYDNLIKLLKENNILDSEIESKISKIFTGQFFATYKSWVSNCLSNEHSDNEEAFLLSLEQNHKKYLTLNSNKDRIKYILQNLKSYNKEYPKSGLSQILKERLFKRISSRIGVKNLIYPKIYVESLNKIIQSLRPKKGLISQTDLQNQVKATKRRPPNGT